ncbi:MAG: SIS domain-containing protein [Anaerolineales bacterium]|jgi:6-phospho-3-hexuloisomerase|nr:MAG: SIS domain-containing protein [Anaerolineales bacterium]
MTICETARQILAEIDRSLSRVSESETQALLDEIVAARCIIVYGLGREGLAMRGFAMRLMHLGLDVAVVGDMTTPPIGPGDLFLVSCGPGYLATVQALAGIAHQAGGRIAMLTAQPTAPLPQQADLLVYLPAQTMAEAEQSSSVQSMGSAFEQTLWIYFDALVPRLQAALGQSAEDTRRRHTNLE